jgi:hypothetical protein
MDTMAYTEADTRAKLIDPILKSSDWLESHIVREDRMKINSPLIKFSGIDKGELKEAFGSVGEI